MVYDGYPEYSEVTPGFPPSCYCSNGHFNVDKMGWEMVIGIMHTMGRNCKDFEGKE